MSRESPMRPSDSNPAAAPFAPSTLNTYASSASDTPSPAPSVIGSDNDCPSVSPTTPSTSISSNTPYTTFALADPYQSHFNRTTPNTNALDVQYKAQVVQESLHSGQNSARPDLTDIDPRSLSDICSVTSSSEAHDVLGPLPLSTTSSPDRPILSRGRSLPAFLSTRSPAPSPPAVGLSELFAGTHLTAVDGGYFSARSRPAASHLHHSGPFIKRPAPHSPFISNYGLSQSDRQRMAPAPDLLTQDSSYSRDASSRASSDTGSSTSRGSRGCQSPQIQNHDGILAPHGTFSSRLKHKGSSTRSNTIAGNARSQQRSERPTRNYAVPPSDPMMLAALEQAAKEGDQLASYRLGQIPDTAHGQRYSWGSQEDVWGLASPSITTRGSSVSSQASIEQNHALTRPTISSIPNSGSSQSDLFSDASHLISSSEAAMKALRRKSSRKQ